MESQSNTFDLFYKMMLDNPAPMSAYIQSDAFSILSTSPERFLKKKEGRLETRPIKGTVSRGKTAEQDELNRNDLINSEKNRAELLMITDLMRNDLGRVSQTGSVHTPKIWECEAYTNVFHLVSTVQSEALPDLSSVQLLRQVFPAGSITGCPKLSAMEVIHQQEKRARGIYTGSIGYFSGNGDFDFNVAIRTLLAQEGMIDLQVGGAVVIDSVPEDEFKETEHKGASMFKALGISCTS